MTLLSVELWPLCIAALILLAAAVENIWTLKVRNRLTHPGILSGWAVAALASFGAIPVRGGLGPSLAATFVGFVLLVPWMSRGILGAGCVKAQMAFGAWLGCAADLRLAVTAAVVGALVGSLFLGVVSAVAVFRYRHIQPRRFPLLPAQVPLTVGSILGAAEVFLWS